MAGRRQNLVFETLCFEKLTERFLDMDKKMDNVQKHNSCANVLSSQTFRSYLKFHILLSVGVKRDLLPCGKNVNRGKYKENGTEKNIWTGGIQIKGKMDNFNVIGIFIKSSILWDTTLYSMLKVNRCFRLKYCLHLQSLRITQARNQRRACGRQELILPKTMRLVRHVA
jgi:hypothetical protein